jgi:exodeoxyribonuclease VII large subunit
VSPPAEFVAAAEGRLFDQAPAPRRLRLVHLAGEIARSLVGIGRVAVEGEVHRPQRPASGWVYFTLRDRAAQISVSCPSRNARRCRAVAGERVVVVGSLVWRNEWGQLNLEAEEVAPVGEGAIAVMVAEARARLAAEGLLDRPRRPLPVLPRAIGVVCGSDAAVRKDIESVVAARFPGYPVVFEETTVSGPGAALSILDALAKLARAPEVDVVVMARGGGDAVQLLPWSDEDLCRAVAAFPVPVVSAIGHESDHPLCDEVADLRCGTPSLAAQRVVPDRLALRSRLEALLQEAERALGPPLAGARERLGRTDVGRAFGAGLERARTRLRHDGERLGWAYPGPLLAGCRRRLEACDWQRPFEGELARCRGQLMGLYGSARALSPAHVVERGFAVARRLDGSVVRSPAEVSLGEPLTLTVAHGVLRVVVTGTGASVEHRP